MTTEYPPVVVEIVDEVVVVVVWSVFGLVTTGMT